MKRRIRGISPVILIMPILMAVMATATLWWNRTIFYFEAVMVLICFGIVLFSMVEFKRYIKNTVNSAEKAICGIDKSILSRYSVPIVVIGKDYDVLWFNSCFRRSVCKGQDFSGESIFEIISSHKFNSILDGENVDVEYSDRKYTVFGIQQGEAYVFYFIDDTYYKEIKSEYVLSRPAVATIIFDNREELESDEDDADSTRLSVKVEDALQRWASRTTGFIKKLSNGKYVLIMEERNVREFIDEKFGILKTIRDIKVNNRMWATVSIGIGKGGRTLKECEHWSRLALDMALGRGGDQVAIKSGDSYKFFGGVSKGVEKRNRVRPRVIASALTEQIKHSDCVMIMGHRFSDLDSVGASIGMFSATTRGLNKDAYIVVNKEQTLALSIVESIERANLDRVVFISPQEAIDMMTEKTLLIIVDTHSPNFIESPELYEKSNRVIVIDHHRMMVNRISNALVFYHEPYASSASEMVAELIQYMGDENLDRLEADALLAGIMLDTKNFVLKTGVRTFEASAYLRRKGADTVEVKRLFSNSIDTYKVKYQLVSEAEIFNSCAIACADDTCADVRVASAQAADELMGIQGVKASFVMYPDGDTINVSARSFGDVNVQLIMEAMGGGGHQTMAGTQIKGKTMTEAREELIRIISELDIKL